MNYFENLGKKLTNAFLRFPEAIIWATAGGLFLMVHATDLGNLFDHYQNFTLVYILGISWLLGCRFLIEPMSVKLKILKVLPSLAAVFLIFYYYSLPEPFNSPAIMIRWRLLFLAGHVFLFFAPFLTNGNHAAFWNYLKDIIISIMRSLVFTLILYSGVALAFLAVENLLHFEISSSTYLQLFILCLGIINTCMYVADFPKNIQENTAIQPNKPLNVFVQYILMPLLALYLLILYLYSFRILIALELPQGWIAYLMCTLAIAGFIIQIIINPLPGTNRSFLFRNFYPWFYILLLPLLGLLFVAVFKRIAQYNFTELRYLLMVLSFWILGMVLYLFLSKKREMRIIPISFFLLIILSIFGPWSAFQVSLNGQERAFAKIIQQAKKENLISGQEKERMNNIVNFMDQRQQINRFNKIVGFSVQRSQRNFEDPYNTTTFILDSLHIHTVYENASSENIQTRATQIRYQRFYARELRSYDIKAYDHFIQLPFDQTTEQNSFAFKRDTDDYLRIQKGKEVLLRFNPTPDLKKIMNQYGSLSGVPQDKLIFTYQTEKGIFKVVFKRLTVSLTQGEIKVSDGEILLFYK